MNVNDTVYSTRQLNAYSVEALGVDPLMCCFSFLLLLGGAPILGEVPILAVGADGVDRFVRRRYLASVLRATECALQRPVKNIVLYTIRCSC